MEAEWFAERAALRCLARAHLDWTQAELAATLGRSRSWVAKWLARLDEAEPSDLAVLHGRSCARHTPPPPTPKGVVERSLAIRDNPPDHLRRVPGPKAILYFLPRDVQAQALDVPLPRSTRTIWKVLRAHGRIAQDLPRRRQPLVRPAPLEEVQIRRGNSRILTSVFKGSGPDTSSPLTPSSQKARFCLASLVCGEVAALGIASAALWREDR